jgi:hypothetical protein
MSIREMRTREFASKASAYRREHRVGGHAHIGPRATSRRQFGRAAAGAAVMGSTLGSGSWSPCLADDKGPLVPVPIPGGSPLLGGGSHVFAPKPDGSFDPIDVEPVTITNLNGFIGLAYIGGMVTQTNTSTGEVQRRPFVGSDMRFMSGRFRGADGRVQQGAFALV